jgi:hypothetical protein
MIAALPLLFLVVQFVLEFNTTYYFDVRFDASTKGMVERLDHMRRTSSQPRIRVGVTPFLFHSFQFYRQAYGYDWLEPAGFDGPTCMFGHYALLPWDRDRFFTKYRLSEVYSDGNSGAILARPTAAAFPELAELTQFGFTDPVPCNVDCNKLGPVVDMRQPEVEVHFLRDIVGAPGPGNTIWVAPRPALLFRAPGISHRILKMEFLIHRIVLARTGSQRLTIRVNGKVFDQIECRTEGLRTYCRPVPAQWMQKYGITLLEIESDRYYVSPLDGQKLSFLLGRTEFAVR